MLQLNPNQANQTARLTLFEGHSKIGDYTHYLLVLNLDNTGVANNNSLAQVVTVTSETERITTFMCTTVGLDNPGKYFYTVYGQNLSSNIDPTNAAVVGVVEIGVAEFFDIGEYYIDNTTTDTEVISH